MAWRRRKAIFNEMKPEDRIATIKNFVEGHRFLVGLKYRVLYEESTDTMTVDFKSISETQLWSFRGSLRSHDMDHIKVIYQKLEPMDQNRKTKRQNNKKSGGYNKN